jgi:hypothetical protein
MSGRLRLKISMSLDGFVAGPRQSVDDPLGVGGMRLHEWVFPLAPGARWSASQGGEVNESTRVVEESMVAAPSDFSVAAGRSRHIVIGGGIESR